MTEQPEVGFRELLLRFADDPDWVPATSIAITHAVVAELPDVAGEDFRDALSASIEANFRMFVEMIRSGLDPTEATPPPAAVEYARELVRRGISIDSLLRAYFLAHATFLRGWIEQVHSEIEDPAARGRAIEEGATWTFAFIQALTRGIVERYNDERERWIRSAAAVKAEAVRALLAGEPLDLAATAARLRYPLEHHHHLGFVVWVDGGDEAEADEPSTLERAAVELAESLEISSVLLVPQGTTVIAGWLGSRAPLDQAGIRGLRLPRNELAGARAALGSPGVGVPGFRQTHAQAHHARRVAVLRASPPGSVTTYPDVALAALASTNLEHAREFVRSQLGPLSATDDHTRRLSETLLVYLEEGASPRRTAHRIGVHENTIANRIRAAQELIDQPIDQRVAELLVALRLAPLTRGTPKRD